MFLIVPVNAGVSDISAPKFASSLLENCNQISSEDSAASSLRISRTPVDDWEARPIARPRVDTPAADRVHYSRTKSAVADASTGARSWSLPVADGAMASIPVWSSRRGYLALVARVLQTPRAVELRGQSISVKAVLAIAEQDAASADRLTGRNVTTSHDTVARELGISGRLVGTGRRLLEKLHLARTVVTGRYLSPTERAAAKALHGGKQIVAASVRVLTMPAPSLLESTFHLPRSGEVNLSSSVIKKSPTRARARATAATRPQLKKKTSPRRSTTPRDPAWQRFAWEIATEFDLLATPLRRNRKDTHILQLHRGSLAGDRHIGTLIIQLQRHGVTPTRYSARSLRVDLQRILESRLYQPPAAGEIRDRFLHFVWKLGLLVDENLQETTLEAEQRRSHEWQERNRAARAHLDALAASRTKLIAETQEAATAALKRRPTPPVNVTRISWQRDLVTAALPGQQLHETPVATQIHIGEIFTLDRALTDHAFTRTHTSTATTWENAAGQTLTLEHATLHLTTTTLPHNITNLACMKSCMQESK